MPLYEFGLGGKQKDAQGNEVPIPPRIMLANSGPVFQVVLSVTPEHEQALTKAGQNIPKPIGGFALIDTGASLTGVTEQACQQLGIQPTGVAKIWGVSGADDCNCYALAIHLPGGLGRIVGARVIAFKNLTGAPPPILLFGRDLLQRIKLTYNGPMGRVELDI